MKYVFMVTLKGIFRDRIFRGVLLLVFAFLLIPSLSTLSMRQVPELALTLSFSLISFIALLLAVFLGGTAIWKDMERRYTFSVLGLPLSRNQYLLGKFFGNAVFLLLVVLFLGVCAVLVQWSVWQHFAPSQPQSLGAILIVLLFVALKYILLVAIAFLFSTISTSFFLPIFSALAIFLVGSATQEVYDFILSPAGQYLPLFVQQTAKILYFILPNLSAFDYQVYAIYGLAIDMSGVWFTVGYFLFYTGIVLTLASYLFCRRELT